MTALAANTAIAVAKGTAAALTGSPALLAETLHTIADAGNELFLWVALRRSRRAPDATHPLGYGPERYYWALLAAVGMFVIGATLSVWEGVKALIEPPSLDTFWVGVAVLVIAIALDSVSRAVALRQLRRQAAERVLGQLRLVAVMAIGTWMLSAALGVWLPGMRAGAPRLMMGAGWLLAIAALGSTFAAWQHVSAWSSDVRGSGAHDVHPAAAIAPWLLLGALALTGAALLVAL
jgi:cation diffusion facilitator family transporter